MHGTDPPLGSTYLDLLAQRARTSTDQLALAFLDDGKTVSEQLHFGELDRQARALAERLGRDAEPGERALLLYPPGLDFAVAFFGCLYAGLIAVPAYPPQSHRKTARLHSILRDAEARLALSTDRLLGTSLAELAASQAETDLVWIATDRDGDVDPATGSKPWAPPPGIGPDTLAFLQYTSGSTGDPKGVMISHANLLYNQRMLTAGFGTHPGSVLVSWLPLFHDMGLIGKLLHAIYVGVPCYLMSPMTFLKRPHLWLQAISRYRGTLSGAPNFAFDLCARRFDESQVEDLDLSCWEVAYNASEPIHPATLHRFAETFAPHGFRPEALYPCYGLAEATVMVSGGDKLAGPKVDPAIDRVACGRTVLEQEIRIVDPQERAALDDGKIGEIWVHGPHVARGYWRRPEASRETFGGRILGEEDDRAYLRTGDLGYLKEGELYLTGRLKEILILHGINYYPQDLEITAEAAHPALRSHGGAAFSIEADDEERAVLVQEIERSHQKEDPEPIFQAIRRAIQEEHEIRLDAIVLIKSGSLEKTSSGKIQRRACRQAFLDHELRVVAEWRDQETREYQAQMDRREAREELQILEYELRRERLRKYLRLRIAYILGLPTTQISNQRPLSYLGVDSLSSIELLSSIEDVLHVHLPLSVLLDDATVPGICDRILLELSNDNICFGEGDPIAASCATPEGEPLPLSHGQKAMWFLHKLAPDSTAYNVEFVARIESVPQVGGLQRALSALVERHPSLRTIFREDNGEPRQIVLAHQDMSLDRTDVKGWSSEAVRSAVADQIRKPFDLERGPVFRAHLFTLSPANHILVLTAHHIVIDLWSIGLLLNELRHFYALETQDRQSDLLEVAGAVSPELENPAHYLEFVRWQQNLLAGPQGERLWDYWKHRLRGELPTLELPTDRTRPTAQTWNGASRGFTIDPGSALRLEHQSRSGGATMYHILLTAFFTLLYRYSHQKDILIGTPATGRNRSRFQQLVGYCVNPVPLRAEISGNPSFKTFLDRIRRTALEALDHQDLPFSLLVERLQPARDPSYTPIFQTMFLMQKPHQIPEAGAFVLGHGEARMYLGGLMLSPYPAPQPVALFDLSMTLVPVGDSLHGSLQYNTDLFDEATIQRMVNHYGNLLAEIGADGDRSIETLAILTEVEREQLLRAWNRTDMALPEVGNLAVLLEEQAHRTPDTIAVVFADRALTYGALDAAAEALAGRLLDLELGPEDRVGLALRRSAEMLVAMVASLKAGTAYVPLDLDFPADRLSFMISDAEVGVVLVDDPADGAPDPALAAIELGDRPILPVIDSRRGGASGASGASRPSSSRRSAEDPARMAYILYTSGSTGRPKGVQISHAALINLLLSVGRQPGLGEHDVLLALATISFDIAGVELFLPLLRGARVEVAARADAADALRLAALLKERRVSILQATPPTWRLLAESGWSGDPHLKALCTGEAMPPDLAARLGGLCASLWNLYGPTETTIFSTLRRITRRPHTSSVPIGRPVANTQIYILDRHLQPVPVGVLGELYIGGRGLTRGYLGRPGLSAEKLIPHPFSERGGERLYRTGDLARYLPDGDLEFTGRIDHQIKLRGFRIELGEIEAGLRDLPEIADAAAAVREVSPGDPRLIAYFTSKSGEEISAHGLRAALAAKLPDYMVPSSFIALEAFPLTPSGKLDRKALPTPVRSRSDLASTFAAPKS